MWFEMYKTGAIKNICCTNLLHVQNSSWVQDNSANKYFLKKSSRAAKAHGDEEPEEATERLDFRNADWEKFEKGCSESIEGWLETGSETTDINEDYRTFVDVIHKNIQENIPRKTDLFTPTFFAYFLRFLSSKIRTTDHYYRTTHMFS